MVTKYQFRSTSGLDRTETRRVAAIYDGLGAGYDRTVGVTEWLLAGGRGWAGDQARGEVLEIAVGTGLTLPHYPAGTRLTALDIAPQLLAAAVRRSAGLPVPARFVVADAQQLPFADVSFDTVAVFASLCSIPDEAAALAEAWRVLRPGGRLVAVEHVASDRGLIRALQRRIEGWMVRTQGDHQLRTPERAAAAVGFRIDCAERSRQGLALRLLASRPYLDTPPHPQ